MKRMIVLQGTISLLLATGQLYAQQIAYNVYDTIRKDYEVYVMNADGSGKKNITNTKAVDWTYYAYKNTLYFISDRDTCHRCFFLYSCNSDGSNLKKISDLQLEDSWMSSRKSGTEMVVSGRTKESRFQLYLLNLKDGSYKQLTNDTAAYFNDPAFVNNGSQIAYRFKSERRNRNMITEIWIMDADGKNRRQLTSYPKSDTSAMWHDYHAGPPKWNAKKEFISYQSKRQGMSHVFAVLPSGKRSWQITNTDRNEGWHDWSKDGRWIVFDYYNNDQTSFDIMIMNVETGENRRLSRGEWNYVYAPVFIDF